MSRGCTWPTSSSNHKPRDGESWEGLCNHCDLTPGTLRMAAKGCAQGHAVSQAEVRQEPWLPETLVLGSFRCSTTGQ